jgi:hypothetical protein
MQASVQWDHQDSAAARIFQVTGLKRAMIDRLPLQPNTAIEVRTRWAYIAAEHAKINT